MTEKILELPRASKEHKLQGLGNHPASQRNLETIWESAISPSAGERASNHGVREAMDMPDRKSLVSTLWLTSLLALLALVLVAPIRTSGFVTASSRPDCHRRDFALPPRQPTTSLSAVMATDVVLRMKALPFDPEEQDRADALDEPRVSFPIPCSFHKIPNRRLIAPRPVLSLYPLRC